MKTHNASTNVVWHHHQVSKLDRCQSKGQKPCILWFTGLSGSGKSTIANAIDSLLFDEGAHTCLLDGDNVRHGLNKDLGFSDQDRIENIRRIGEVSKLFVDSGLIVLTAFISPFIQDREMVRRMVEAGEFIEVFIDTPLEICEQRDPKGLYQKARSGEIKDFTGISSPYEPPVDPEIHLKTDQMNIQEAAQKVVDYLKIKGYVHA